MPSWTTLYRAVVMIAAGVIVVKGWQQYGPSAEKVKAFAMTAVEKAQAAWNESQAESSSANVANVDPRTDSAQVAGTNESAALLPVAPGLSPIIDSPFPAAETNGAAGAEATAGGQTLATADGSEGDPAIAPLLTKLQELGGADAKVAEWGSSGELYRCSCRATSDGSPLSRHFEAVANEPTAAVAQVVAKVEAWRTQQQHLLR